MLKTQITDAEGNVYDFRDDSEDETASTKERCRQWLDTHEDTDMDELEYPSEPEEPPPSIQMIKRKKKKIKWRPIKTTMLLGMILALVSGSQAAAQENVIFESIGEMTGATSYLHVQVTISLSSITQQFELYKGKLKAKFIDPHRVAQVMNAQFAQNLNTTVDRYLESRQSEVPASKKVFQNPNSIPAPHMNSAVVWSRIAQLHYEDLYEIGLHLSALKHLLPKVHLDQRERVVATSNFFKNIQPNVRKDNIITDSMEVENEFLEQYPDLHVPDHMAQRLKRSARKNIQSKLRFDQGMTLFEAPFGTRLEDWYLHNPMDPNEERYWVHNCPKNTSVKCVSRHNHIPVIKEPLEESDFLKEPGPSNWESGFHVYPMLSTFPEPNLPQTSNISKNMMYEDSEHLITAMKSEAVGVDVISPWQQSKTRTQKDHNNERRAMGGRPMNFKGDSTDGVVNIRRKRFAGLVALPIAVAASAMGIYNTIQIEYLKGQLTEIKENTGRLFTVVDNHETAIQDLEAGINLLTTYMMQLFEKNPALLDARFTRIENQLRDRIRQATHALQAAQHRRLAVDLLSPNQVNTMFEKLNLRAAEFNCDLLVKFPSDLLQLEVSLLFDGEDAHLLLHVPMMPKESVLRLFRLHPFPLPLFADHFLIPDVKNDVLAVSSTDQRLHVQLSSIDLMGCHRMNQLFLCDQFGVLSQRFNKTCLGALYMQDFKAAQEICEFTIEPVSEKVYSLKKNRFLVYLPQALTVPIKCVNGTKTEKHLGAGSQTFSLSSGCEAQFLHHLVLSDLNIKMPADVLHFTWDWVPADLFDAPEDKVAPELAKLAQLGISRPKLKDLQYQFSASSLATWGSWHHILLYVVIGILVTLTIALSIMACVAKGRTNQGPIGGDNGVFTNMLAMMGLQQHQQNQADNIRVRYDHANQREEDNRLHYEGTNRYPDINTRPDQLLLRLQGMQSQMDQLKDRNLQLEENRQNSYPTAPSVQNPNKF